MPTDFAYPEPPLPAELQQEIEASCDRFRAMFPALLRSMAEEYVPKYRAELAYLIRKAWKRGATDAAISVRAYPVERPATPVQGETQTPERTK